MKAYPAIFLFFLTPAVFGAAPPSALSVNKIIRKMELVREEIDDLVTVVERGSSDPVTGQTNTVAVRLSYKKPDKLITEVGGEDPRRVFIKGEEMWVFSPLLEMVEEYHLNSEEKRLAAIYENSWGLTSPIKALVRGMNRSVQGREEGNILVELSPDRKDAPVEKILVWIDPETWLIRKMKIFERGLPAVTLTVKSWEVNSGLSDGIFDFEPPPGVDIFQPLSREGEVSP